MQRSLDLHEANAEAHKFCGILLARSAKDTKQKIANGYKIRTHTQVGVDCYCGLRIHRMCTHSYFG